MATYRFGPQLRDARSKLDRFNVRDALERMAGIVAHAGGWGLEVEALSIDAARATVTFSGDVPEKELAHLGMEKL